MDESSLAFKVGSRPGIGPKLIRAQACVSSSLRPEKKNLRTVLSAAIMIANPSRVVGKRDERCGVDSGWVEVVLRLGRAVDATGSPVPIAHANLKSRTPRRLRLTTIHIEA